MNEKLRDRREYLGLTQRKLARMAGVGKTTITAVEGGDRLANVVTALRIAKALKTTVESLWEDKL